jgi:hypothetical protein
MHLAAPVERGLESESAADREIRVGATIWFLTINEENCREIC